MGDKLLQRSIENQEAFGGRGQTPREPMNTLRVASGLPKTTPEEIARKRQAMIRLSRRKNKTGWMTGRQPK